MPRYIKPVVFIICLLPLVTLVWDGFHDALGANPVEKITHRTGDWTLRLILLTLTVTPLRKLFNWKFLMRYRRMLGLFAFFYASLHFSTYLVFDHFFDFSEIAKDILKRPYVTVGFTGFVLMIPLAITSTNKMKKRLGKNWKRLHQLVYVVAVCGILHYLWLVKADILLPLVYAAILIVLLTIRVWFQRKSLKPVSVEYSHKRS
ncbi:sulfite oxidase heme-binding subunit YedZ [Kaarinaea lacus]